MARQQRSFFDGIADGYQMMEGVKRQKRQDELSRELHDRQIKQLDRQDRRATLTEDAEKQIAAAGAVSVTPSVERGEDGSEVERYKVGSQTFESRARADQEATRMNAPLAVARRQWETAQKLGVPELAERYGNIYGSTRKNVEDDFKYGIRDAMQRGGAQGVVEFYNSHVNDGRQLQLDRNDDGTISLSEMAGGKLTGKPRVFGSEKDFLANELARYTSSPEAYLEAYHRDRQFAEGVRARQADESFRDREFAWRQGDAAQGRDIQRSGVAAQLAGVGVHRESLYRPQYFTTQNADGTTNFYSANTVPPKRAGEAPRAVLSPMSAEPGAKPTPQPGTRGGIKQPSAMDLLMQQRKGAGASTGIEVTPEALMRLDELMKGGQ